MELSQRALMPLCILMLVFSGARSQEFTVTDGGQSSVPIYAFYFPIEIMNRVYNASLFNPESHYYSQLYEEVSGVMNSAYNCSSCYMQPFYRGVVDMSFSNGSVIAIPTIVFQTDFVNAILLKNIFVINVPEDNVINGLLINPKYTEDISTPVPAPYPGTATTTPLLLTTILNIISNKTTTATSSSTKTVTSSSTTTVASSSTTTVASSSTSSSSSYPYNVTSNYPIGANTTTNTTTTTNSSTTSTNSSNTTSNTSATTTKKGSKTEPILLPTSPAPVNGTIYYYYRGVPGWAIALLVLASIILLLLIILLIITLVRLCCGDSKDSISIREEVHTPYERTTFKEPLSTPSYSPHTPQRSPITPIPSPFEDPAKPKVNRTGMYVVNPER